MPADPPPPTQQIPDKHPDLQRPPTGPAPIYMDPSAYQAMLAERDELLQFKARATKEFEAKEAERLQAQAKAGELEKAWAENDKRWEAKYRDAEQRSQTVETAWLTEKKNAAIAEALNGRTFVGDPARTAALVRRLLAEEIEASRDAQGNPVVYDRTTRRPAADYLKERLESPDSDFAPLLVARNRGGAGTDGTRAAGGTQPSNDPIGDYMRKMREARELAVKDPSRVF